jgi:putative sterol carrier protein
MTSIAPIHRTRRAHAASAAHGAAAAAAGSPASRTSTAWLGGARKSSLSVKERFATLEQRFKPDAAKGVNVRLQFKLSGEGGGEWYVEIKDGKCKVKEGTGPNPDATLMASASDYKKIADGEMNKMVAFLRGKLKVEGDKEKLKPFDTYFEKP